MEVNDDILKAIAEELSLGIKCFLNKETSEVVSFPDEIKYGDFDIDDWKEDIDQVKNNPQDFIEIEPRNSSEAYRTMEWFIDDVQDEEAKLKLTQAIAGKKPFAGFERQLQEFPGLIDEWIAFNKECNIDFIKQQLG
jgi:t-SNARE complex subunit (syntaxin)